MALKLTVIVLTALVSCAAALPKSRDRDDVAIVVNTKNDGDKVVVHDATPWGKYSGPWKRYGPWGGYGPFGGYGPIGGYGPLAYGGVGPAIAAGNPGLSLLNTGLALNPGLSLVNLGVTTISPTLSILKPAVTSLGLGPLGINPGMALLNPFVNPGMPLLHPGLPLMHPGVPPLHPGLLLPDAYPIRPPFPPLAYPGIKDINISSIDHTDVDIDVIQKTSY